MKDNVKEFSFFGLPMRVLEVEKEVKNLTKEVEELENAEVSWGDVQGKPTTFLPTIGTTSTTAKAGNYTPTAAEVVTAISAMNETQKTAVKTALGIA